jgi:hypothetical protein
MNRILLQDNIFYHLTKYYINLIYLNENNYIELIFIF